MGNPPPIEIRIGKMLEQMRSLRQNPARKLKTPKSTAKLISGKSKAVAIEEISEF